MDEERKKDLQARFEKRVADAGDPGPGFLAVSSTKSFDDMTDAELDDCVRQAAAMQLDRTLRMGRDYKLRFMTQFESMQDITIGEFAYAVHEIARSKGWWEMPTEKQQAAHRHLAVMTLLHQSISARTEHVRDGHRDTMTDTVPLDQAVQRIARLLAACDFQKIKMLSELANIHAEISEAAEAILNGQLRMEIVDGKPEGLPVELMDAVIRVFDTGEGHALDLVEAGLAKTAYNGTRPYRHGGKLA